MALLNFVVFQWVGLVVVCFCFDFGFLLLLVLL